MDWHMHCLIQFAIANHKFFYFKFQNQSEDAKVIRVHSEDPSTLQMIR